jgi:hypothetical protein
MRALTRAPRVVELRCVMELLPSDGMDPMPPKTTKRPELFSPRRSAFNLPPSAASPHDSSLAAAAICRSLVSAPMPTESSTNTSSRL